MYRILILSILFAVSCSPKEKQDFFSNSIMASSDIILKNSRSISNDFSIAIIDSLFKSPCPLHIQLMNVSSLFEKKDSVFKLTSSDKIEINAFVDSCVQSAQITNSKIVQIANVLQLDIIKEGDEIQKKVLITDLNVLFNFAHYNNILNTKINIDPTEEISFKIADSIFKKNICFQSIILDVSSKELCYATLLNLIRTERLIDDIAFYAKKESFITPFSLNEEKIECSATALIKTLDSLGNKGVDKIFNEDSSVIFKDFYDFKNLCKKSIKNSQSEEIEKYFKLLGYFDSENNSVTLSKLKSDILILVLRTRTFIFSDVEFSLDFPKSIKHKLFQQQVGNQL